MSKKRTVYFFFFFFVSAFGFGAVFAFGPGPRLSHCFKCAISSSVKSNIALTPMYRFGVYPCLFSLCLVASDDIPPSPLVFSKRFAISSIVYSICSIIDIKNIKDQGENVRKSDKWTKLQNTCIVKNRIFFKFSEISFQTLDHPLGRGYYFSMSDTRTYIKRSPETPEAERHPIGAKGEFYGKEKGTRNQNCGTGR